MNIGRLILLSNIFPCSLQYCLCLLAVCVSLTLPPACSKQPAGPQLWLIMADNGRFYGMKMGEFSDLIHVDLDILDVILAVGKQITNHVVSCNEMVVSPTTSDESVWQY